MPMYSDSYMANKPEFQLIGTYFGKHNAEDIARVYSYTHEVVITCSEISRLGISGYDFYSVWGREIPLIEKLMDIFD